MNSRLRSSGGGPLLLAVVLGLLLTAAGCGRMTGAAVQGAAVQGDPASARNAADAARPGSAGESRSRPDQLTVMLDWYPNAVHSFLYAAEENGYFADRNLKVKLRMPAETNDALRLAAAGQVDLALTYQPQVLMARGASVPVKAVSAVVRHPLNRLLIRADEEGITRPRELPGRTIGYSSIPLYDAMLRTMVEADGGDSSGLNLVDVGYDLIPALATGRTDAVIGGFVNHEELLLDKQHCSVLSLNPADFGVPDYAELVFAASEQTLAERGEVIRRFLAAAAEGQAYVNSHPQEALAILLKHEETAAPLDPEIERASLALLLPLMDFGDEPYGYLGPESWEQIGNWLKGRKLLPGNIDPKEAGSDNRLIAP
ncbi:ABC transporter substrate-binding protein [Paenibacillus spiritus]|uniref:ABC transporter substrate-binding protein n=1 Tax=Paenibacillus spiritus TaxID=2496557 RepID=A0A5J5G8V6_9BACL|nr:ABC transporter substrate-binding protein [Paenibacillus spiritus]KAA9004099.1 ABC transporter substrate-binding protein [Paenibacillus spiritus]